MSSTKRLYKRRTRKILGYILLSGGIFCIVVVIFVGLFSLLHKTPVVRSPISSFAKMIGGGSDQKEFTDVEYECYVIQLSCKDVRHEGENGISFMINDHKIIISSDKNIHSQMASLQVTMHQLTMEGKEYRSLDFRYDRPVILY